MDIAFVAIISALAGATTVVGGLLSLRRRPTTLTRSLALGFAGGVLLATVTLEILPAAFAQGSLAPVAAGAAGGLGIVYALDLGINRGRVAGRDAEQRERVERYHRRRPPLAGRATVFASGVSLEEALESLAIGVGAAIEPDLGLLIAGAIAVENLSEGLSIGELVRSEPGVGAWRYAQRVLGWTGLIAVITVVAAVGGWAALRGVGPDALAFTFALAGGGLFYLTVTDLLPVAQDYHYQQSAAIAALAGLLVVLALSTLV